LRTYKRSFKIDLKKHAKSQGLVGRTTLNFANLSADSSFLSDALAYEFYRDAGVPASRTAFARLLLTIDGRFNGRLLGLYVIVENPDAQWAREQFGVEGITLFKPVTYELFKDLGDDWKAYEGIYDPKTKTKPKHQRRVIELAKFVTAASDSDFAERVGEFIDLDEFARFLACEVILSNYDSILDNGQNFLIYLDPRTDKFGFIPWDLDHSWGEFPLIGTADLRERASLWHPWVGQNRFLQRMLTAEPFRARYREEIERLLATMFVPERLNRRLEELAAVVRLFIAEESTNRLAKFEIAVADKWSEGLRDGNRFDPNHPVFQLKRFFGARAESVRRQLEGKAAGVELPRAPPR
jgi:spore coat protein CotH